MFKQLKTIAAGAALVVASAAASAAPWVNTYNPSDFQINSGGSHTWTHDITTNGFVPGVDTVTGFTLQMSLADDPFDFGTEYARYIIPSYVSNTFEIDSGTYGGNFSISGSYVLNTAGILIVTLQNLGGDFEFRSSTLTAEGRDGNRVPEPGTLALVGLALGGAGFLRKRTAAKK